MCVVIVMDDLLVISIEHFKDLPSPEGYSLDCLILEFERIHFRGTISSGGIEHRLSVLERFTKSGRVHDHSTDQIHFFVQYYMAVVK